MIKLFLTKYDKYPFQKCTHLNAQFAQLLELIERFREKNLMLHSIEKRSGLQARIYHKMCTHGEFFLKNGAVPSDKKHVHMAKMVKNSFSKKNHI